ncbi:hypothetical protein BGX28_010525 [Mortierella sp. GBA30]|nr:hypothetical protein BGX28_010525 [Mortierella sp. GBA30]
MARVASSVNVPLGMDIPHPNSKNDPSKRVSDFGLEATAIKVDKPYHFHANQPFVRSKDSKMELRQQNPQAYVNKYSSYTNSSKSIRLVTIPSKKVMDIMNEDLCLNSPTSPLVSPPPPYLHSYSSEQYGDTKSFDKKRHSLMQQQQQPSAQWPSMMKLSPATGITTATVTRPKAAKVMPPQAIPIHSDEGVVAVPSTPRRTSRLFDSNQARMFNIHAPQDTLAQGTASAVSGSVTTLSSIHETATTSQTYPSFWKDARQSRFHWVILPLGCLTLGSALLVLTMQIFVELAIIMPLATLVLLSLQFGRYRWKRGRFLKQQHTKNHEFLEAINAEIISASPHHEETESYLAPHQPSQHPLPPSRQRLRQHHVTFQDPPSPQTRFNQQSYKQPRVSHGPPGNKQTHQRQQQPDQEPQQSYKPQNPQKQQQEHQQQQPQQQQQQQKKKKKIPLTVNPGLHRGGSNIQSISNGSPTFQNPQFLSPVDSPQSPPPAYFLKKIELPEIDPVVGEFEIDFSCIKY